MAKRVLRRRDVGTFLATFVGAEGELLVDLTNQRVQLHDGATQGGHVLARVDDLMGRTVVANSNYSANARDNFIAFSSLTATRTVTLPRAIDTEPNKRISVADESGACSSLIAIRVVPFSGDFLGEGDLLSIESAYGMVTFVSNGVDRWFIEGASVVTF